MLIYSHVKNDLTMKDGYNSYNYLENIENSVLNADTYVNATYVNGIAYEKKFFLCTQGPIITNFQNYWKMIFNKKINIIIMLCNLNEECNRVSIIKIINFR
jgi:protein tyrosine phosphatase